jgi:biopolymer transport protein ExbD/biopolymer transport protein TolR
MFIKRKAAAVMAEINVIPMADIMLVLLIIFMVVVPMIQQQGPPVDLAPVTAPKELPGGEQEDAIFVTVARDGAIFLGMSRMNRGMVGTRVKDLLANRADRTVYLKSDARARYGAVVGAVDEIRAAGVEQLALVTERARPAQGGQRWE